MEIDISIVVKKLITKSVEFLKPKYKELKPLLSDTQKFQFKKYFKDIDIDQLVTEHTEDIKHLLCMNKFMVIPKMNLARTK
jgi:hypothetical protein